MFLTCQLRPVITNDAVHTRSRKYDTGRPGMGTLFED